MNKKTPRTISFSCACMCVYTVRSEGQEAVEQVMGCFRIVSAYDGKREKMIMPMKTDAQTNLAVALIELGLCLRAAGQVLFFYY